MTSISVPARRWHDNIERELTFPDRWEVSNLTSPGMEKAALSRQQLRDRIDHPVDGAALGTLAQGKQQAVIVFDDMTRPTPTKEVAEEVLEILHDSGLGRDQIRFIWSLGSHGTYDMISARKKLGDSIVENYAVYNHDAFQNTTPVGRTPTGVELWLNREYMACDLRIGIGCITAHVHAGFGGGAKLIMPGVAGIETINQFHNQMYRDPSRTGLGNFDNNIMRAEVDAAGDVVGLDFTIDCLINRRGEIAGVYAGSARGAESSGVAEARGHYGIPHADGFDIVVSNAYGKASEAAIAIVLGMQTMKPGSGTVVLILDAPEGQVPHYAMRAWGTGYGGRQYIPKAPGIMPQAMRRLIVLNPHPDRTCLDLICHPDDATVVKTWDEVLALLAADHPGPAKVAVIQDATMQYLLPAPDRLVIRP